MITGSIKGQKLSIIYPDVVSDSINYLTAKFLFRTNGWDGCVKTAYFTQGTTAKAVVLTNDQILESDGLNLSAGTWKVKLTGVRGTTRITTNAVDLRVVPFGTFSGDDLPDITPTEAEQILSMIGNLDDLSTSEKINLVAAINEIANRTGSGAGEGTSTQDHTKLENRDAADQHPISAITGLQEALNKNDVQFVNITENSETGDYVADKTFDEIKVMIDSGTFVVAIYDGSYFPMREITIDAIRFFDFMDGFIIHADGTIKPSYHGSDVELLTNKTLVIDAQSSHNEYPSAKAVWDLVQSVDFEKNANKVTSLSADSTDTQYPSAKCVYTMIGNIESALGALL